MLRYHIQLEKHRTTISLDNIVADLLALQLNLKPGTKAAHQAIRKQLEAFIAHDKGRAGKYLSRYITQEAILTLVDKTLAERYIDYICQEVK